MPGEVTSRSAAASTAGRLASRSACAAGITPFNFPASADVDVPGGGSPAATPSSMKPSERDPSAGYRRAELLLETACRPACQRRQRRQGSGRRIAGTPDVDAISLSARPRSPSYIYATRAERQTRAGAGRAKNHMW